MWNVWYNGSCRRNMGMCKNLELKAISELKGYTFTIPYQQRGYRWTEQNIITLLNDLKQFKNSEEKERMYCLQPLAVVVEGEKDVTVIDGQQRLTTLYLIHKYLTSDKNRLENKTELFHYTYERDTKNERKEFLRNPISEEEDSKIDFFFISKAYLSIKEWFENENNKDYKQGIEALLNAKKKEKSIQVLWYPVDTKKQHEVFRNINSGKIPLTNSDLIKALLLNRQNGIENRDQIAAQFEQMERQFAEDRFWYILQKIDVNSHKGQSRIDLLFNMVGEVSKETYEIDARASFFKFANYNSAELFGMWKKVREKFQRIKDIFDDLYTFHYVGFLIYCNVKLEDILNEYSQKNKSDFVADYLKPQIKCCIAYKKLNECNYGDGHENLKRLFIMHNIETILQRYESLNEKFQLRFTYEYFPFELLNKQKWNIEHIASRTDNDLDSNKTRIEWIDSILANCDDYNITPELKKECVSLKKSLQKEEGEKTVNDFNSLYEKLIKKIEDDDIKENEKDSLGNLVLLDEHTNTSFHNSLFPRKRKIVLVASGLRNEDDKDLGLNDVKSAYVPICTQQVYTKSYNKKSDVKLNSWGKDDCKAYLKDMKEKLADYFTE